MFGIDNALSAVANLGSTIVDKIWPDANETEKAKANQLMAELQGAFALQLAQIKVNESEAQSASLFVAGWRPFVGWVCGSAFAYEFLFRPLFNGIIITLGYTSTFPGIEIDALNTLLFGLLGLGTARTVEKVMKVNRR